MSTNGRRLANLYAGLVLFGASMALMLVAGLGLGPWDVLHQGLADRTGLPVGWVVAGAGTRAYAVSIGPLAHYFIPRLTVPLTPPAEPVGASSREGTT
jgi:hypothetical protein